jgi:alpha-1,3-mannosyltransferase
MSSCSSPSQNRADGHLVWCWGWDGAGDLDGPDVDPIWEKMPARCFSEETIQVKHYRNMVGL